MEKNKTDIVKKFLEKNHISFSEIENGLYLDDLNITIDMHDPVKMSKMEFSILAMEIGAHRIQKLQDDLEKNREVKIYDFRQKKTE